MPLLGHQFKARDWNRNAPNKKPRPAAPAKIDQRWTGLRSDQARTGQVERCPGDRWGNPGGDRRAGDEDGEEPELADRECLERR